MLPTRLERKEEEKAEEDKKKEEEETKRKKEGALRDVVSALTDETLDLDVEVTLNLGVEDCPVEGVERAWAGWDDSGWHISGQDRTAQDGMVDPRCSVFEIWHAIRL